MMFRWRRKQETASAYTMTVRWSGGDDFDAAEFQDAVKRLAREVDPHAKLTMFGNADLGTGMTWLPMKRAQAARARALVHGGRA